MARNELFMAYLEKMRELHESKNNDYADSDNPYSNFEGAAKLAGTSVDTVFQVLLGIKVERLRQLVGHGKEANYESIEDSILDLANYAVIWLAWRKQQELGPPELEVEEGPTPGWSRVRLRPEPHSF